MSTVAPINFPMLNLPIPTAWTNALSYMEMIGKLVDKVNELIDLVNTVVESTPIDYNLQQINGKISVIQSVIGWPYNNETDLSVRTSSLENAVSALNTAIGMPYTGTALKTRVGSLEFNLDGYVTSYNSAIGMPYSNPDSLNTRVSALESAE